MADANPKLSDTLRYLCLTISAEVKCENYIELIANWLSVREPESLVKSYMSAFRPCIKWWSDLVPLFHFLSHRHNLASPSLFYEYFRGNSSDERTYLVACQNEFKRCTSSTTKSLQVTVKLPAVTIKSVTSVAFSAGGTLFRNFSFRLNLHGHVF